MALIFRVLVLALLVLALLVGCTHAPTQYYQLVKINEGPYMNRIGILVANCSGFENYKISFSNGSTTCVNIWNMEGLE